MKNVELNDMKQVEDRDTSNLDQIRGGMLVAEEVLPATANRVASSNKLKQFG